VSSVVRMCLTLALLGALLLSPLRSFASGNEPLTLPLPDSYTGTFRTDSRNFWLNELPRVLGRYFPNDFVYSGGLHSTSATCTSTAFGVEAFVKGPPADHVGARSDGTGGTAAINYALVGANCVNPGTDTARVAACSLSGNSFGNWQRASGSNYFVNAVDTNPGIPTGCAALMDVSIVNGAITLVIDLRLTSPVPPDVVSGLGKNVRECGAVVDGVTDDTVALNNCLATYTHVFVPEGVLLHSGTIVLNISNRLSGVAPGQHDGNTFAASGLAVLPGTTLRYTGSGDAISFVNPALQPIFGSISLENFMLRSAGGQRGVYLKNVVGVLLHRVFVDGRDTPAAPATGFSVSGIDIDMTANGTDATFDITVDNCMVYYVTGIGIRTGGNNVNIVRLIQNGIQGAQLGCIAIQGHGLGVLIQGNEMEGCGVHQLFIDYGAAVHVVANYSELSVGDTNIPWMIQRCTGCTFENNIIFGQGSLVTTEAVSIGKTSGGFTTQGITIRGNYCSRTAVCWGIHYAQGLTIEQNVLFVDVTSELGGDFVLVQAFDYKRATCDPTGSGTTCPNDESRPVTVGQNTANVVVVNTVTETIVYTSLVKGHTIKNEQNMGGVRLFVHGTVLNLSAGTVDMTVRTYIGTTVLSVLRWQAVAINGAPRAFKLEGVIRPSLGFPGNQECVMHAFLGAGDTAKNTVVDSSSTDRLQSCYGGVAGVDLTADQTLKITVEFSVAHANIVFVALNAYLQRIGY
jgi:hypothetical protein